VAFCIHSSQGDQAVGHCMSALSKVLYGTTRHSHHTWCWHSLFGDMCISWYLKELFISSSCHPLCMLPRTAWHVLFLAPKKSKFERTHHSAWLKDSATMFVGVRSPWL
jgi:hypothetical protein